MATLPERPDFEAGYQAVYDSGALTHDVYRNAAIWRAVEAALKAALPADAAILTAKTKALRDAADVALAQAVGMVRPYATPEVVAEFLRSRADSIEKAEAE